MESESRFQRKEHNSMSYLKGLECKQCGTCYPADRSFVCLECFGPLEVSYDYSKIQSHLNPKIISQREENLWRYRELLPVTGEPISGFHSGYTPLVRSRRLAEHLGVKDLYLKDDSVNRPTLSWLADERAADLGRFNVLGNEQQAGETGLSAVGCNCVG